VNWLKKIFTKPQIKKEYKPCVTLGWDLYPTMRLPDGYIYPRSVEMQVNAKYYPNNKIGEWLCDPNTGEKLPIAKRSENE